VVAAGGETVRRSVTVLTSPNQKYLNPPPKDQPQKVLDKLEKERQKRLSASAKERCADAVKNLEGTFADLCAKAVGDKPSQTFALASPDALDVSAWHKNITEGEKHEWARENTGIGECLTDLQNADGAWKAVPGDIYTQQEWRTAHAELLKKLNAWKPVTTEGLAHPTMTRYRTGLIAAANKARSAFEKVRESAEKPATAAGGVWAPGKAELKKFPLTGAGWDSFKSLAKKHGWKKDSPGGVSKRFKAVDKAAAAHKAEDTTQTRADYQEALTKLQVTLGEFKAKHFETENSKGVKFQAAENYVEAMKEVAAEELNKLK
jgi:hypothetical protein